MLKILAIIGVLFSQLTFAQGKPNEVDVLDLSKVDLEQDELDLDELEQDSSFNDDSLKVEDILEPSEDYQYASFGRPDPFARPKLERVDAAATPDTMTDPLGTEIPMISPLQAYPLEQLQIKGVWVHRNGEARAVIMTPKKEGIVIKKGDPISAGKVISISRRRVLVRQYSIRADGSREYKDVELYIGNEKPKETGVIRLQPGKEAVFDVPEEDPLKELPDQPAAQAIPNPLPVVPGQLNQQGIAQPGLGQQAQLGQPGDIPNNQPIPLPIPGNPMDKQNNVVPQAGGAQKVQNGVQK